MIIKKSYNAKRKSIYQCDRCKRTFEGSNNVYRHTITNIKSSKSLKSIHLCKHCTKVFLAFIKKGVNNNGVCNG